MELYNYQWEEYKNLFEQGGFKNGFFLRPPYIDLVLSKIEGKTIQCLVLMRKINANLGSIVEWMEYYLGFSNRLLNKTYDTYIKVNNEIPTHFFKEFENF